jgi:hypothetical protein
MARYLARPCPRCNGYLGIVLRESGRNTPVRAVNGHCLRCGYRLAWIVISGKQADRHQSRKKRYAEPAKNNRKAEEGQCDDDNYHAAR